MHRRTDFQIATPQAVYRRDMDSLLGFLEKPLPGRTTAALNHLCPWCDIAVSSESSCLVRRRDNNSTTEFHCH
jgi:hypothetical protein